MHEKTAKKCQKNALREELTVGLPRAKTNISALQTRAETEQTNDKKMSEKTAEKCSKNLHKNVPKTPKKHQIVSPTRNDILMFEKTTKKCPKNLQKNVTKSTPKPSPSNRWHDRNQASRRNFGMPKTCRKTDKKMSEKSAKKCTTKWVSEN